MLEAGDFRHRQVGLGHPDVNEGLDLEAVSPEPATVAVRGRGRGVQVQYREVTPPEDVVPVAEVGVVRPVAQVEHGAQREVAQTAQMGEVGAAAPLARTRPLGEVESLEQGFDVGGDLAGIGRAVRVDRGDDVAGGGGEATRQGVALAPAGLRDHPDARPLTLGDGDRVVG
jgi:hypothetical protein